MASLDKMTIVLNKDNYGRWKATVADVLKSKRLMGIVDGSALLPAAPPRAVDQWIANDALAKVIIRNSLDNDHEAKVRGKATAKDMWDHICRLKERRTQPNVALALQEFYDLRWKGDVETHLSAVTEAVAKLTTAGRRPDDQAIINKVLTSLPADFAHFRSSWNLNKIDDEDVTYDDFQAALEAEADIITASSQHQEPESAGGNALNAERRKKDEDRKKKQGKKKRSPFRGDCFGCGEKGHMKAQCPMLKEQNSAGNKKQSQGSSLMSQQFVTKDSWIGDSGASWHMTNHKEWFVNMKPAQDTVIIGDGKKLPAEGVGDILVQCFDGRKWVDRRLTGVRFVPALEANLLSFGAVTAKGMSVMLSSAGAKIINEGQVILIGRQERGIFHMRMRTTAGKGMSASAGRKDLEIWHQRLGHPPERKIRSMLKHGVVSGLDVDLPAHCLAFCQGCAFGRQTEKPHPLTKQRKCGIGEIAHSDLMGPMSVPSLAGSRFVMVVKDEASSWRKVYLLKTKDATLTLRCFKDFVAEVKASSAGRRVVKFRSDNGTEFKNKIWDDFLLSEQIIREEMPAYSSQSNGFIERENRSLMEKARSLLYSYELPARLWAEAVNTAAYLLNRLPFCRQKEKTPFELWHSCKPDVSHLKVFGCDAFRLDPRRHKVDKQSKKGIMVGYGPTPEMYRVYDSKMDDVFLTRDVVFDEESFAGRRRAFDDAIPRQQSERETCIKQKVRVPVAEKKKKEEESDSSAGSSDTEIRSDATSSGSSSESDYDSAGEGSEPYTPPRHFRKPEMPAILHKMTTRSKGRANIAMQPDPTSVEEALADEDSAGWKEAMDEELKALKDNGTWELTSLPAGKKTVKCRWIFKRKRNPDGSVCRLKARLVAKGFSQQRGIDYEETYSPVVRHDSIRVILALAAELDLEMIQFDVKTAFLHGELEEHIFMDQPAGFNDGSGNVCRLRKGLYGLKQAPRQWNKKFHSFLVKYGLKQSSADNCVYYCRQKGNRILLSIYVDDGLLCCQQKRTMDKMLADLNRTFSITQSDASYYVGLQIERCRQKKEIRIHQAGYIDQLLAWAGMTDCKPAKTPGDPKVKMKKAVLPADENTDFPYRETVGKLMYAMVCSRPDIAYMVSTVARFVSKPAEEHVVAVKRILRYLKGTKDLKLVYAGSLLRMDSFVDADYAADEESRRSVAGKVHLVNNGPVAWSSRLMQTVALSTTEAEYMAVTDAVKDVVWLRQLLNEIYCRQKDPTPVWCDNQSAIALVRSDQFRNRTKHIGVRFHYIRQQEKRRVIHVRFIRTDEQPADMMTKSLCSPSLESCRRKINMTN